MIEIDLNKLEEMEEKGINLDEVAKQYKLIEKLEERAKIIRYLGEIREEGYFNETIFFTFEEELYKVVKKERMKKSNTIEKEFLATLQAFLDLYKNIKHALLNPNGTKNFFEIEVENNEN